MAETCENTVPLIRIKRRMQGIVNGKYPFPPVICHLAQLLTYRLQLRLTFPEGTLEHDLGLMQQQMELDWRTWQDYVYELFQSLADGLPKGSYASNPGLHALWLACYEACFGRSNGWLTEMIPLFLDATLEE